MFNFMLGIILGSSAMLVVAEYVCKDKPVELNAARQAYWAKVADGPKHDRLIKALDKMQSELDRKNKLYEDYLAGK